MIRLGSNSKTRALILKSSNIDFVQNGSNFDEDSVNEIEPKKFVIKATRGKYDDIMKTFGNDIPLVVADTVVSVDNNIIRKANSEDEAIKFLNMQSGNIVTIITYMIFSKAGLFFEDLSSTKYSFCKFEEKDIEDYISSNLWQGKAGACMVEGFCKKYIKSQTGLTSTAMGLSIEKLLPFIKFR
jgi:septum formation protein